MRSSGPSGTGSSNSAGKRSPCSSGSTARATSGINSTCPMARPPSGSRRPTPGPTGRCSEISPWSGPATAPGRARRSPSSHWTTASAGVRQSRHGYSQTPGAVRHLELELVVTEKVLGVELNEVWFKAQENKIPLPNTFHPYERVQAKAAVNSCRTPPDLGRHGRAPDDGRVRPGPGGSPPLPASGHRVRPVSPVPVTAIQDTCVPQSLAPATDDGAGRWGRGRSGGRGRVEPERAEQPLHLRPGHRLPHRRRVRPGHLGIPHYLLTVWVGCRDSNVAGLT